MNSILHFCILLTMWMNDASWSATSKLCCFIHTSTLSGCPWRVSVERCSNVWERADTVLPRPLSHWCMAANYGDKSLTLLLLAATRMHLMQNGREVEDGCVCDALHARLCLLFWVTNCSVVAVPLGGHYKVNWMNLQLSKCRYSLCVHLVG